MTEPKPASFCSLVEALEELSRRHKTGEQAGGSLDTSGPGWGPMSQGEELLRTHVPELREVENALRVGVRPRR